MVMEHLVLLCVVELKHINKKITLGESSFLLNWKSRTSFAFVSNLLLRMLLLILVSGVAL